MLALSLPCLQKVYRRPPNPQVPLAVDEANLAVARQRVLRVGFPDNLADPVVQPQRL
jgi:hypothetical protein